MWFPNKSHLFDLTLKYERLEENNCRICSPYEWHPKEKMPNHMRKGWHIPQTQTSDLEVYIDHKEYYSSEISFSIIFKSQPATKKMNKIKDEEIERNIHAEYRIRSPSQVKLMCQWNQEYRQLAEMLNPDREYRFQSTQQIISHEYGV